MRYICIILYFLINLNSNYCYKKYNNSLFNIAYTFYAYEYAFRMIRIKIEGRIWTIRKVELKIDRLRPLGHLYIPINVIFIVDID